MNIDRNRVPGSNSEGISLKVSVTSPTTKLTLASSISEWRPSLENTTFCKISVCSMHVTRLYETI